MKTRIYLLPTREPPRPQAGARAGPRLVKPPPWPPGIASKKYIQKIKIEINTSEIQETTMKKDRKKQEDRLLKHLSLRERQRQVQLRRMIAQDPMFLVV